MDSTKIVKQLFFSYYCKSIKCFKKYLQYEPQIYFISPQFFLAAVSFL